MKLNAEQFAKAIELVRERWKANSVCSVCGNNNWGVSEQVYELREFRHGSIVIGSGDAIAPVLPVTCQVCGHTILFNALLLGIDLKESKSDVPAPAAATKAQAAIDTLPRQPKKS